VKLSFAGLNATNLPMFGNMALLLAAVRAVLVRQLSFQTDGPLEPFRTVGAFEELSDNFPTSVAQLVVSRPGVWKRRHGLVSGTIRSVVLCRVNFSLKNGKRTI
jgi:hypothetical protein